MGGRYSLQTKKKTDFAACSNNSSSAAKRSQSFGPTLISQKYHLLKSGFSMSTSTRSAPYPYPRSHSAFILSPSRSCLTHLRPSTSTFRPPLNRSIPPIPESRSNESLRTASSVTASNSKHSLSQEAVAKTPTERENERTGHDMTPNSGLVLTPVETVFSECKNGGEDSLVIENPLVSGQLVNSRSPHEDLPPKHSKSPLIKVCSKVKTKFGKFGVKLIGSHGNQSGASSGSSEGSVQNLTAKDLVKSRARTVSESVSEMALSSSEKNRNGNPCDETVRNMKKTQSLEETSKQSRKKNEEFGKVEENVEDKFSPSPSVSGGTNSTSTTITQSPLYSRPLERMTNPKGETLNTASYLGFMERPNRPDLLLDGKKLKRKVFGPLGSAPLAESECSTVANSPAVELPPGGIAGPPLPTRVKRWPKKTESVTEELKASGKAPRSGERTVNCTHSPVATFQSRLIHPSPYVYSRLKPHSADNYSTQQHLIYGALTSESESQCGKEGQICLDSHSNVQEINQREVNKTPKRELKNQALQKNGNPVVSRRLEFAQSHSKTPYDVKSTPEKFKKASCREVELGDASTSTEEVTRKTLVHSPKRQVLNVISCGCPNGFGPSLSPATSPSKNERNDSGVRVSGGESSASSMAESSASKLTSPGSEYKGLIDDEIRDQPELIGNTDSGLCDEDGERGDQPSDLVGPVRRSTSFRSSAFRESLISTTTIDSDDCMLDFEGSFDLVFGDDEMGNSVSTFKRSLKNSLRGSKNWTFSLDNQKPECLVVRSDRDSIEVAMEELNSMVNTLSLGQETTKSGAHSQADQVIIPTGCPSNSEVPVYETKWNGVRSSPGVPVLRPPASLSQELAGQSLVPVDGHVYRSMVQDLTVVKTLLLRLKGDLQKAETLNPFETGAVTVDGVSVANGNVKTGIGTSQLTALKEDNSNLRRENMELRDQVASLKQQLAERDAMIRRLQLQLQRIHSNSDNSPKKETANKQKSPPKYFATTDV